MALPEAWEVVPPSLGQRAESDYSPEARDKGDPKARGELGEISERKTQHFNSHNTRF